MKRLFALTTMLIALFGFSFHADEVNAQVQLNELLAATVHEHESGESLEWVELRLTQDTPISLAGFSLSDDPEDPRKWVFPNVRILPGEPLLIWTTGLDQTIGGAHHTNFRLNREGEFLGIYNRDGVLIDGVMFPAQRIDISYGRHSETSAWGFFQSPTPSEPNTTQQYQGFTQPPQAAPAAGVYANELTVMLTPVDPNASVRYTRDGSLPTANDPIADEPVAITETTVLRARTFRDGYIPGETETNTYIVRGDQPLPIMTLTTEPDNLWDRRTGIYANATQHGREWERVATVEYFLPSGERAFNENAGLRIHGGASRERSPKKSFRLYFRGEYGPRLLEYPLIPHAPVQRFNQLVLRGGFNDTWSYDREMQRRTAIYVSDQVVRDLHEAMGHLASKGIFVELYLNGEYWGLYNPCERYEDGMMQEYYGTGNWDVIVDDEVRDGSIDAWNALRERLMRNPVRTNSDLAELQQRIDLENFTDYLILNTWMQNYDWPRHNWYSYRPQNEMGVWRFLCWDIEYSFGSGIQGYRINQNTLQTAMSTGVIGMLTEQLAEVPQYQQYFWRRLQHHLAGALQEENVQQMLNSRVEEVRPVIPRVAERWATDKSIDDFDQAVEMARSFIENRTPIYLRQVEEIMGAAPVHVRDWHLHQGGGPALNRSAN